jgi:DNA invertase Pin-like site-specific DNA recombinase
MKAAIYARVSTVDQTCENQLLELRRYVEARGWTVMREYVDEGVSGAMERRPALDALVKDVKRRRVDVVVCWRLDRLGRNLRHVVTLLDDLQGLGIAFVSLGEGIDCTTPVGKLQLHILAALAEFERERIRQRVVAGLARVKSKGQRLGRPEKVVAEAVLAPVRGLPDIRGTWVRHHMGLSVLGCDGTDRGLDVFVRRQVAAFPRLMWARRCPSRQDSAPVRRHSTPHRSSGGGRETSYMM